MSALPWNLRRRQADPLTTVAVKLAKVESERDDLRDQLDAVLRANSEMLGELRQLRAAARLNEPADVRTLRRQAEQDRRNMVVLSDALAIAEGRRAVVPLADEGTAEQLLAAVRSTVTAFLGVLERAW